MNSRNIEARDPTDVLYKVRFHNVVGLPGIVPAFCVEGEGYISMVVVSPLEGVNVAGNAGDHEYWHDVKAGKRSSQYPPEFQERRLAATNDNFPPKLRRPHS